MVDTPLVLPIYKCLYGITYRSVIWIISIWNIEHFIQITRFSQDIVLQTTYLIQTHLHGYPFNHTVFSYLYISFDLTVFQMIYKTKQITRFMTKHFLKHKSWIPFSQNLCISQAFLCWRTYFYTCFRCCLEMIVDTCYI